MLRGILAALLLSSTAVAGPGGFPLFVPSDIIVAVGTVDSTDADLFCASPGVLEVHISTIGEGLVTIASACASVLADFDAGECQISSTALDCSGDNGFYVHAAAACLDCKPWVEVQYTYDDDRAITFYGEGLKIL